MKLPCSVCVCVILSTLKIIIFCRGVQFEPYAIAGHYNIELLVLNHS
jgi:hypothetical protein